MKLLSLSLALSLTTLCFAKEEIIAADTPDIPNSEVLNMKGETIKFYDGLIKDKIVAMNFVFSSCPTICSVMQVNFAQLQKQLKAAGATDVSLISVTVDPVNDTPARLKAWSQQFGAEEGWSFITGDKTTIDHLLKKLEVFTADIDDHPSFILIGNDSKDSWKRISSLAPVETLTKELTALSATAKKSDPAPKAP